MRFLREHLVEISLLVVFIILFLGIRLYNLTQLPLFTDEAIYLRWAQIAKDDSAWRFISLTDGKQPLFIWFIIPFLEIFTDPLFAGRFVSVLTGCMSMIGLFFLGKELFRNKWVGIFSAGLYLIYPMALVYDRMALYESTVGAFTIWAMYIEVLLVRRIRLDIAFILSFVIGGAMLTKTNGFFSAAFLPFTLLLFDWKRKERIKKLLEWGVYAFISFVVAYVYYSILRLSPFFHIIGEKNGTFVYSIEEWLTHPFLGFVGNIESMLLWLVTYVTIPIVVLIVISFFIERKYWKEKVMLFLLFFVPFVYLALVAKVLYPRYIFPMTLSLLPLAALTLVVCMNKIKRIWFFVLFLLVILLLSLRADYLILTDFARAPLPQSDINQYNNDWPSGKGIKEAVTFFQQEARKGPIYIATEGTFGLLPYGFELYLVNNKNVTIKGIWPLGDTPSKELLEISKKMPTYIVFYQPCPGCVGEQAPTQWPVKKIFQVVKESGSTFTLYKVSP